MQTLLSSPGMTVVTTIVFASLALSLGLLWINVHLFRSHRRKYHALLSHLGDGASSERAGHLVLALYVGAVFCATVGILFLFVFQPHLL